VGVGAVEHLKTLCCLGLPPESAMIAVVPLLHEIVPHGASRMALLEPDATLRGGYSENPATTAVIRERFWRFVDDPLAPASLWGLAFRATAIGWSLHRQGRGYLESAYYREVEAPLDSGWLLDAMIGERGRTFALVVLTRPRSARPFTVDDVQRLDHLRPWLAHALRPQESGFIQTKNQKSWGMGGAPVLSGEMILTPDAKLVFQSAGLELLLTRVLHGASGNFTRYVPAHDKLPAPIVKLLRQITDAANGTASVPPRTQVSTAYGVLTLEAQWLAPAGTLPVDAARDPKSCLISVTIELREHPIAHAARVLRESGATPTQTKVGIQLALGKTRSEIADELGIQITSVADHSKKLYQNLDVHNSTELATKIWLDHKQGEASQSLRRAG
jgi:DNA-binding CsgD family transcriptional regulator